MRVSLHRRVPDAEEHSSPTRRKPILTSTTKELTMNISRIILATVVAASIVCATHAQDASPESTIAEGGVAESMSVRDMIDNYLQGKGWTEGENQKASGSFFVSVGIGEIQAPLDHRNYIGSRVIAYDKAMLYAKEKMVEYLGLAISTETELSYTQGDLDAATARDDPSKVKLYAKEQMTKQLGKAISTQTEQSDTEGDIGAATARMAVSKATSLMDKCHKLFKAKLDGAIRQELSNAGVDPDAEDKAAAAKAAKKLLASEQYRKMTRSLARAQVTGMQVCCTFESVPAGKKGQIGVVAIWSPKLQAMAESMSTGGKLPTGVGKASISEQVPADKTTLLSTFGVQQKINENGKLVLVSFGQAAAVTDSSMSAEAAYEKAKLNALEGLRAFAGETVAVANDMTKAESFEEFERAAAEYEDLSSYRKKIRAVADKMNIAGVTTVKRWECVHPLAKRKAYGVVLAWSPEQAENARRLRSQMESVRASGGASVAEPAPTPNYSGSFGNAGASADEDAF